MISEILNIGVDTLSEPSVHSNCTLIVHKLELSGVEVNRCCCFNGGLAETSKILTEMAQRSDIALIVGGLGPGNDDLTPMVAARAADVALILDQQALESIESKIRAHNTTFTESYQKQAMLPAGAQWLKNSVGVTPGFHLSIGQCDFFFLPEDPYELRQMLTDQVLPRIIEIKGSDTAIHPIKVLSIFGLTKSTVSGQLNGLGLNFSGLKFGIRTKFPQIQVTLSARGTDVEEMQSQIEMATQWVCRKLGDKVISDAGESMEKVVGSLLRNTNSSLALAESCTGGLIADLVTNVPGSSDYFVLSAVTYSNRLKEKILDVNALTLDKYGAVSEQTAKEMARGVQQISNATFGLSISGIAGPGGATEDKPVGTVCIGLADTESVHGYRFNFTYENRWMNKHVFALTALDILRRKLLGISCSSR